MGGKEADGWGVKGALCSCTMARRGGRLRWPYLCAILGGWDWLPATSPALRVAAGGERLAYEARLREPEAATRWAWGQGTLIDTSPRHLAESAFGRRLTCSHQSHPQAVRQAVAGWRPARSHASQKERGAGKYLRIWAAIELISYHGSYRGSTGQPLASAPITNHLTRRGGSLRLLKQITTPLERGE